MKLFSTCLSVITGLAASLLAFSGHAQDRDLKPDDGGTPEDYAHFAQVKCVYGPPEWFDGAQKPQAQGNPPTDGEKTAEGEKTDEDEKTPEAPKNRELERYREDNPKKIALSEVQKRLDDDEADLRQLIKNERSERGRETSTKTRDDLGIRPIYGLLMPDDEMPPVVDR